MQHEKSFGGEGLCEGKREVRNLRQYIYNSSEVLKFCNKVTDKWCLGYAVKLFLKMEIFQLPYMLEEMI